MKFAKGQIVKWEKPSSDSESADRLEVVSQNGACVTVRSLIYCTDFFIRPTQNVRAGDLIAAAEADKVADAFIVKLREWLTPEELAAVDERNAREESPIVCHSHDFCDANVALAEVFEKYGLDPLSQDDSIINLWNTAWDIAKVKGFSK